MKLFEQIRKKHEDRLLAKAELIKEQRHAEQEKLRQEQEEKRLLEEQKLEERRQEEIRQAQEIKIQQEARMKKLEEERPKILASKVPVEYMIKLVSNNYNDKDFRGNQYVYERYDNFVCDTPVKELVWLGHYSQFKFKKVSGDNIGEVYTSVSDKELRLIDSHGHVYTQGYRLLNEYGEYLRYTTIEKINESLEELNSKLKSQFKTYLNDDNSDKDIKDYIFNL